MNLQSKTASKVLAIGMVVAPLLLAALFLNGCKDTNGTPGPDGGLDSGTDSGLDAGMDAAVKKPECADVDAGVGNAQLGVRFTEPVCGDLSSMIVNLYSGSDATGTLLESQVFPTGEFGTIFYDISMGSHFVQVTASDSSRSILYEGSETVCIQDILNNHLDIILNKSAASPEDNYPPCLNYVEVHGDVVLCTELDPEAAPKLYCVAPYQNESVTFVVDADDVESDPISYTLAVKDGPAGTDADVGSIVNLTDTSFSWSHSVVGKYWATFTAEDDKGGVDTYQFEVYVRNAL